MTFRTRIALAAVLAAAITGGAVAGAALLILRNSLATSVDDTLRARAAGLVGVAQQGTLDATDEAREEVNRAGGLAQIIDTTGKVVDPKVAAFPVPAGAAAVARGQRATALADVGPGDGRVRVLTIEVGNGTALELGTPLDELERNLRKLALVLGLVSAGGVLLAVALGWLVAHTALRPLDRLTATIDEVAETTDLSRRVAVTGGDELARLARDVNRLLAALEEARALQAQLVADASHELRTPLTSLRTNVEVLQKAGELDPSERESLRQDVLSQLDELAGLVSDVIELARGRAPEAEREEIELADLVAASLERAHVHARAVGISFEAHLTPSRVRAVPSRLERAVSNLLDNAVKWSPAGGVVEVTTAAGAVRVRDRGPGIPESDLPKVFDRFFRAPAARPMRGSGLGLAIVREVAEADGGSVEASNDPDGGAVLEMRLPELRREATPRRAESGAGSTRP